MSADLPPPVPAAREITIRQELIRCLEGPSGMTARELSAALGIPEKSVPDHLEHLQKSLRGQGLSLTTTPASCLACGFVFRKRTRLSRPGKCPVCRGTHLSEPRFALG